MRRALVLPALLLAIAVAMQCSDGALAYSYSRDDTLAALAGHSALAACIVRRESNYEPYAVGAAGELGVAQLHPRGLLPLFYAQGYVDWTSPYAQVEFLDWALANGYGPHWSTYWGCR